MLRFLVVTFVLSCMLGTLLQPTSACAEIPDSSIKSAEDSITDDELKDHAAYLSNDSFEGREAGTRGGQAAGGYIVKELSELDLKPAGDGSFYQSWGNQYRNILALLEGTDPQLKRELIVVGAHYDHVGYGTASNSYGPLGYIHNGADDNASGTSALLELAEAFSEMKERPKRSVLFAWWDAEEKGLLGSKHWLANRTLRDHRIVFDLNMDMVGRMDEKKLEVSGIRTAPGLREFVARNMDGIDAHIAYDWNIREDSDHWPFFNAQIPFIMLHTGLHDNYHRPSDDSELLNIEGMRETTRLALRLVADVADRPQAFSFRAASRLESESQHRAERIAPDPPPSRLGIRWDAANEADGLMLTQVVVGSAAHQAGLVTGDRIVALNGAPTTSGDTFRQWIMACEPNIQLTVQRNGNEQTANVQLGGYPVRLGISWKEDGAEPGCVKLSRVVADSPADTAGLALGDRVLTVGGQPFTNADEFRELLQQAGDDITLEMERAGTIWNAELKMPNVPQLTDGH